MAERAAPAGRETWNAGRFAPPTAEEVGACCREQGCRVDAERFCDCCRANRWKAGRNPVPNWRAAVRNRARNSFGGNDRRGSLRAGGLPLLKSLPRPEERACAKNRIDE